MKAFKELRTLHIDNKVWKYVVDRINGSCKGEIRIYDPNKKMYRITSKEIVDFLGENYYSEIRSIYQPSMVKEYIEHLIKKNMKIDTKKQTRIVVISNYDDKTYFFSKDHCQNHGLGNKYVPTTHFLPCQVTPRKSVPDGIIKNVKDLISVFYYDMKEIPNPDKSMQPKNLPSDFIICSECGKPFKKRKN